MEPKTIVSVSGYGATGSSAVIDLLKGLKDIDVLDDFEFQLHYFPDAISDLDYKLNESCSRFYDSDLAIKRFLDLCKRLDKWYYPAYSGHLHEMAEEYINELNPVTWDGYWAYDRLMTPEEHIQQVDKENLQIDRINARVHLANRVFRKLHLPLFDDKKPHKNYYTERKMYMCIKPQNFIKATQKFTDSLIMQASHKDACIIAINQLLPPQNPERFYKYFSEEVKSIVVTRDPRDLWMHYHILHRSQHSPRKNIDEYIRWYKENMKKEANVISNNVLRISFEEIIYNYDRSKALIFDFIGAKDRVQSQKFFNPSRSAVNTKLFIKHPGYEDDILKIENELAEYLFDFSKYENVEEDSSVSVF